MIYSFPSGYGEGCYLVPIDKALIPLVAGALRIFEQERAWSSSEAYEQGYNAFAELQVCMTMLCMSQFLESQARIYRLIDTTFNGIEYTADIVEGETIVLPDIPPAPALPLLSVMQRLERIEQVTDNGFNGTVYDPTYTDDRNLKDMIAELRTLLETANASDEDLLPTLEAIALLLA